MSDIKNIKLEILRSGPANNQLLSPLTPYLALCRQDGPVTLHFPFEQRQLRSRLERLRYYCQGTLVPANQRQSELRDLGEGLGRILGQVPSLLTELGSARAEACKLVHLRLAITAFELAMVPFECAIAPDGFPGSGSPLFLQSNIPITLTREIRHGQQPKVAWNREPRILFIYASPPGLVTVPFAQHLLALRQAIDPWVANKETAEERVTAAKKILTVLPDASLTRIRQACSQTEFTHVHILAHGAPLEEEGDSRYGLALFADDDKSPMTVVNGERLALALTTNRATDCGCRNRPTVVTLATCDSGNVNSVLTPGGSIAHQLHAADIPWVIASQFPLWMRSSVVSTSILYKRLLEGADPRCVLHELRQRLRTSCGDTHDWASIVAYASVPHDFVNQVNEFRDQQCRRRVESKFARIDELIHDGTADNESAFIKAHEQELDSLCQAIRKALTVWTKGHDEQETTDEEAERLGVCGASEKRIGIVYGKLSDKQAESLRAYHQAYRYYRKALELDPSNHWVITQCLSMGAVIMADECAAQKKAFPTEQLAREYGPWWHVARQIGDKELAFASGEQRAYTNSTLAELELLGAVFGGPEFQLERAKEAIVRHCKEIREICGADSFPVQSTVRQFRRYVLVWGQEAWNELAETALTALGGGRKG